MKAEGVASHYHGGDCVTTSKDDKIVTEKIKNLIKIFSNIVKKAFFVFLKFVFLLVRSGMIIPDPDPQP